MSSILPWTCRERENLAFRSSCQANPGYVLKAKWVSLNPAVDRVGSILRQQHGCAPRAQTKVGLFQQSSSGQGASFRDAHMATAGMGRPGSGASRAGIQLARTPTHQARTVSASHQGTKHSTLDNIPLMTLKTCVQQLTLLCMWLTQCYHPACLLVAHAMPSRPHVWLKPAVTRCEMLKLKVSMPCPSRKAGWRCWTPRHGSPCQPPRPPHHQPRPAGRGTDHQGRCVYAEQRGQMVPRPRCSSFKWVVQVPLPGLTQLSTLRKSLPCPSTKTPTHF